MAEAETKFRVDCPAPPHFVFNALNSIQKFIVLSKTILASNYLGKFSDLIWAYLSQSEKEFITLEEEIRFEDMLIYNFHIDKYLQLSEIKIPPILLHLYIENSFRHGLLHKKRNRIIDIKFTKINAFVEYIIKDNGVGKKNLYR